MLQIGDILDRRQQSELLAALEGSGEIPLKFVYMGERGAENWARIAKQREEKEGTINSTESMLLEGKISEFLKTYSEADGINIIDIGCGEGSSAIPILKEVKRRKIPFTYVPLDISKEMTVLAINNLKKRFGSMASRPIVMDYERGNFSDLSFQLEENGYGNLFAFLGSTLGNAPDFGRVLTNFKESMMSRDYFIVGVELTNTARVNRILSNYMGQKVHEFLFYIPHLIGIDDKAAELTPTWNEKEYRVDIHLSMNKSVKVKIGKEEVSVEKGEQIRVARSKKFTSATFTDLFLKTGFRTELLTTDVNNSYAISMFQPSRYVV